MSSNPIRWLYAGGGLIFVGLGVIGAILPGMPSTVFFILALWAFKRSSPRLENWLLNHRVIGRTLRDWDRNKSIAPRTKVVAISMLWACIGISSFFIHLLWVKVLLGVIALAVAAYIWTRPNG